MKAFKLFEEIIRNGLDNSVMTEYKHSGCRSLQDYFGDYAVTGKCLEDGEELLAIWGDENGDPRIKGIADVILIQDKINKIYLYTIE